MWNRFSACVIVFYACFFLFLASGRLSSVDAGAQLQAAMLFVRTGRLGTKGPPPGTECMFCVKSPQGWYYEGHDIGNVALMLPAAWLGSVSSGMPTRSLIATPPIVSRVGAALTHAMLSACGCFFAFQMFALWYFRRTAFLLSLVFATATIYWPYAKTAWDVMGGCVGVLLLLYFSSRLLCAKQARISDLVLIGTSTALVGSFRYSLLPFLLLGILGCLYLSREKLDLKHWIACVTSCLVLLLPTFIYNDLRMGSPFIPGTRAPAYANNNSLAGELLPGLYGLLFSPNRGLFVFAPVFAVLFVLPWIWKKAPGPVRQMTCCYGLSTVPYVLLISKMTNWGAFGWGPRYLVPILPILFLPVGFTLMALWEAYKKPLIALIFLSVALNAAPVLVNWHLASTEAPQATDLYATLPRQHMAVWNGVLLGLRGQPLPAPPEILNDPIRSAGARFPDLWTVRLMERSRSGFLVGLAVSLLLLCPGLWSLWQLVSRQTPPTPRPSTQTMAAGISRR